MARIRLILFAISLLSICWYGMQAIHEFGHVLGAWLTGGEVTQVVLHPFKISATYVAPNPNPLFVVWAGPIIGVVVPLAFAFLTPSRWEQVSKVASFIAAFCLVANGAYIGCGAVSSMGDSAVMLAKGSPPILLIVYGVICVGWGGWIWHRLGSMSELWRRPDKLSKPLALSVLVIFLITMSAWSAVILLGSGRGV